MSRSRQRADRIRDQVPIEEVLAWYGYQVRPDAGGREQQFCCDLHGDGQDTKPSARVYPESQSFYCFACDKTRDAIELVRAKEGCDFWIAVKKLEQQFNLPPLQIDDEVEYTPQTTAQAVADSLATLDPHRTFDDDVKRFSDLLRGVCEPPSQLPMDPALSFWEALDKVTYQVKGPKGEGGEWSEQKGRATLEAMRLRVLDLIKKPQ